MVISIARSNLLSDVGPEAAILYGVLEELGDRREAVAARLKAARLALGLEKKDFAERAGLLMQVYGPFENGKRDLTLNAAKRLRKTYGLTLEFLYFGKIEDLPTRISSRL